MDLEHMKATRNDSRVCMHSSNMLSFPVIKTTLPLYELEVIGPLYYLEVICPRQLSAEQLYWVTNIRQG